MKQTAVEWLQEKISYTTPSGNIITYHKDMTKVFKEAKEMEKQALQQTLVSGSLPYTQKELESLGFFKWLSETYNLVDTDNDIHRTVCNSMAFRWFREKHKIEVTVACYYSKILGISYEERQYHCHIVRDGVTTKGPKFKTYDEAESACIDKLIEIVKTKIDEKNNNTDNNSNSRLHL